MVKELEKEIGDKLMDVLSRDTDCVRLDKLSEDLSDLLKRPIDVDMDYVKKGTFYNDNIRLLVFSRDDGRKKLASFLLKAYPLENGYERVTRIDRVDGRYGYYWLNLLGSKSEEVPFSFGFKEHIKRKKEELEYYNLELLEDLGDVSLEKLLSKKTKKHSKKSRLLKKAIRCVVDLHLTLDDTSKYGSVRKLEDYITESVSNIDYYLKSLENFDLTNWEQEGKNSFRKAIRTICDKINEEPRHIIHLDLHPGNILYAKGKFEIVDYDHVGWGPQQFDLVDLLKHPINDWIGYNKRVNEFVKFYLHEKVLRLPQLSPEIVRELKDHTLLNKDYFLSFLKIFYLSNVIRNIRAIGFSSWLRKNDEDAYKERLRCNPRYQNYRGWYLKDLGCVLDSLLDQNVSNYLSIGEEESKSIKDTRSVLREYKLI